MVVNQWMSLHIAECHLELFFVVLTQIPTQVLVARHLVSYTEIPHFEHLDTLWATEAPDLVFKPMTRHVFYFFLFFLFL